jgi:hypothetical protein
MELKEPSLQGKPTLKLLEIGEDATNKLALPPLPSDLQRLLLSHLPGPDVARLGAVSRAFYRLTRQDATALVTHIKALLQELLAKSKMLSAANELVLRCASADRLFVGFGGFLMLQSLSCYCASRQVRVAVFDYARNEDSSELELTAGKRVVVLDEVSGGWSWGMDEETGLTGWCPDNYLAKPVRDGQAAASGRAALALQKLLAVHMPVEVEASTLPPRSGARADAAK